MPQFIRTDKKTGAIEKKQNQLLKEARDILLPRLMSGMIDVEQLVLPNDLQIDDMTCDEIS